MSHLNQRPALIWVVWLNGRVVRAWLPCLAMWCFEGSTEPWPRSDGGVRGGLVFPCPCCRLSWAGGIGKRFLLGPFDGDAEGAGSSAPDCGWPSARVQGCGGLGTPSTAAGGGNCRRKFTESLSSSRDKRFFLNRSPNLQFCGSVRTSNTNMELP